MRAELAHKGLALLALAGTAAFVASPAQAAEQWSFTPLPYLAGGGMTVPIAINNDGQVIGSSYGSTLRTFTYQAGEISKLPNQSSFDAYAKGINDAGQIVGFGYPNGFNQRSQAIIWSGGDARSLGALATGASSSATDINSNGRVVGYSETSYDVPNTRAVSWGPSGIVNLGVLSGGSDSYAYAINDSGAVVGYSSGGQISGHRATLWQDGKIIDLTFGSKADSEANDINASGQIVGQANGRAAMWFQNTHIDLGTLAGDTQSVANSINSHGWIVGTSDKASNASGDTRATLWRDGAITDLNTLDAVLESGWRLYAATQVNDAGQIIGMGINPNNFYQGFVLSPVPEPGTAGFMLLGWVAVFGSTRQGRRQQRPSVM